MEEFTNAEFQEVYKEIYFELWKLGDKHKQKLTVKGVVYIMAYAVTDLALGAVTSSLLAMDVIETAVANCVAENGDKSRGLDER